MENLSLPSSSRLSKINWLEIWCGMVKYGRVLLRKVGLRRVKFGTARYGTVG